MTNHFDNQNSLTPDPSGMAHIDPELRSLAAELDMLGALDGAMPANGFEDRIMQATLGSLHGVEPVAAQVAQLGAADRSAASDDLEHRVFAESVSSLPSAVPVLRHTGHDERTGDRHIRVVRRVWWTNQYVRLAAAVVLVAGVGIMVRSAMTPQDSKPDLASDLDLLFAVIDNRTSGSDSSESGSGTLSDPEELTKFLIEGAAS